MKIENITSNLGGIIMKRLFKKIIVKDNYKDLSKKYVAETWMVDIYRFQ
jgi:hypothetical protein